MRNPRRDSIEKYKKEVDDRDSLSPTFVKYQALYAGEVSIALAEAVELLQEQVPLSVSDLRTTIGRCTEQMIESQSKLAQSNNENQKVMTRLTWALVAFTAVQAFAATAAIFK